MKIIMNFLFIRVNKNTFLKKMVWSDVGGQHCPCPVLVSFLSGFFGKSCPVSICCPDFLPGICLSRFCQLSAFCPDYKKSCPLSVRPAGQGRDRAVRTFTVLVRRRLLRGELVEGLNSKRTSDPADSPSFTQKKIGSDPSQNSYPGDISHLQHLTHVIRKRSKSSMENRKVSLVALIRR